jgi:hypothetical protein
MKCKFRTKFISEKDNYTYVQICEAEEPEFVEDGGAKIFDVSKFDASECLYFIEA